MRLCAYTRVSTEGQVEGFGLDVQRDSIRGWIKANGHTVPRGCWFTDEGVSGTLAERDGLGDVLDAIRERRVEGVILPRLDRLARDVIVQEQLLAEIWRMGGHVLSCSATEASYLSDDPDDPGRKLMRQMLGAVNSYEREMISLRLRKGRQRKASAGGYAFGAPPFGQRAEAGQLVADSREMEAVRAALALRRSGRSLREIGTALEEAGYPSKRGGAWHPVTVSRLIERHSSLTGAQAS